MQSFSKSPLFVAALAALLMSITAGCQCTPLTNCFANVVDDINDHQGCMDNCYCACYDLTRIGYADWRACRCNRIWCRRCAEKDNCDCMAYHTGYDGTAPVFPATRYQGMEQPAEPPVPAPEPADQLPPVPPKPGKEPVLPLPPAETE